MGSVQVAGDAKKEFKAFAKSARRLIPFPSRKTLRKWFPKFEERNIAYIFSECGIDTILDIGANVGQFATKMRSAGYQGRIISFEPVDHIRRRLIDYSRNDPLWSIAPRMALGASEGESFINVTEDTALSSFLQMRDGRPSVREAVPVKRLDAVVKELALDGNASIALKIDVQGLEQEVLDGSPETLGRAKAMLIELSLTPSYVGEKNYLNVLNWLYDRRFDAVYFSPVVNRPGLGKMYQVDALLVRRADV